MSLAFDADPVRDPDVVDLVAGTGFPAFSRQAVGQLTLPGIAPFPVYSHEWGAALPAACDPFGGAGGGLPHAVHAAPYGPANEHGRAADLVRAGRRARGTAATFNLKNVWIESDRASSAGALAEAPSEHISLTYEEIEQVVGTSRAEWNVVEIKN